MVALYAAMQCNRKLKFGPKPDPCVYCTHIKYQHLICYIPMSMVFLLRSWSWNFDEKTQKANFLTFIVEIFLNRATKVTGLSMYALCLNVLEYFFYFNVMTSAQQSKCNILSSIMAVTKQNKTSPSNTRYIVLIMLMNSPVMYTYHQVKVTVIEPLCI